MYYPIDAGANTRFFQPPPFVPPMMQQFQQPSQQQQPQQPGYWIYCPSTVKPVTGSPAPYSGFSNVRPQQPITSSVRDNSKKENKLAQVYKTELCRQFTDYGRCNYG
uniref:C3H1-type domain-containing protein n=1 Tax=Plectus sambesii TaxID=2011161 RepID=A0A914V599_9BILA